MRKDSRTGLYFTKVTGALSGFDEPIVIIFANGYCERNQDEIKNKKGK